MEEFEHDLDPYHDFWEDVRVSEEQGAYEMERQRRQDERDIMASEFVHSIPGVPSTYKQTRGG
jgi:hypothetical protein